MFKRLALLHWLLLGSALCLLLNLCQGSSLALRPARAQVAQTAQTAPLDPQIRRLRMRDLTIRVVDAAGNPLKGSSIQFQQQAHAFEFGVALSSRMFSPDVDRTEQSRYLEIAGQLFNASVHENALKWYITEPVRGQISYAEADRILDWSEQQGFQIRGHNLFWAVDRWNPDWLAALSEPELRQAVQQHATEICQRYRGRIAEYDVLNEMLNGDFFQRRLGEDIVAQMFGWCHQADPQAQLYTNEFGILSGEQLPQYRALVQKLLAAGVPVGGIGIQAHIRSPITPAQIKQSLDQLAELGLPLKITEFSVIAPTPEQKAQVLRDLYSTAFAHPAVTGIYMWGFWAGAIWERDSAIYSQDFTPEPAAQAYRNLVYGDWWTQASGQSDAAGEWSLPAFLGSYQVTVSDGHNSRRNTSQLFQITAAEEHPVILVRLPN
jgi:GH35 family endo-1,4-beta-xylanase